MIAVRDLDWAAKATTFVPPKTLNSYPYRLLDDDGNLRDCGAPEVGACCCCCWGWRRPQETVGEDAPN